MANAQKPAEYPLRDAVEFTMRDGLPNFFRKLDDGEAVKIAYLGGSITAQNGWRVQSLEWFREQYPQAKINEVNAAIGGTGSSLGVFRLEHDVLRYHPDLLFVEFAVNDASASPENIIRAMEGIVRQTWKDSPETDICFVYTMTARESPELANGKMKRSASVMEEVADFYGIPSVHMGLEAARLEKEGQLVMKTNAPMTRVSGDELNESAELARDEQGRIIFSKDGVHPYPETGHVLYTQALVRALQAMQDYVLTQPHVPGDPLRADNWEAAQQVSVDASMLSGPYADLTGTDNPQATRFANRMDRLYRLDPGATLTFKFKGPTAQVYDLMGPDGAVLEITVDGQSKTVSRMDGYCTYWRLSTLSVVSNGDDVVHEVTVRVLDTPQDRKAILFERNRADFEKSPEKYAPIHWYAGALQIIGELVD